MFYTKTIIAEMEVMRDQGFNYKKIGEKYGKSEGAIQKAFYYWFSTTRKNRRITDEEKALIMRTDLLARDIGKMIGMDKEVVLDYRYRIKRAKRIKEGKI